MTRYDSMDQTNDFDQYLNQLQLNLKVNIWLSFHMNWANDQK